MSPCIRVSLALAASLWAASLLATADGPDAFAVSGLGTQDTLLRLVCRETAAIQVGVADDGRVSQEPTKVGETLPLGVRIERQGNTDPARAVTVQEEIGDTWRQMEGTAGPEGSVVADDGHWLLDLDKGGALRRVEAVAGRSARFVIYRCKTR